MPSTGLLRAMLPLVCLAACERAPAHRTWSYAVDIKLASPEVLVTGAELAGHIELVSIRDGVASARFIDVRSVAPGAEARQRAEEMKRPVVVEYDREGLRGIRFGQATSSDTRRVWRQVAEMLYLPRHGTTEWTARERDDTGVYRAEYHAHPDLSVEKKKIAYENLATPVAIARSQWKLTPVEGSPWAETTADEELEVATVAGTPIRIKLIVAASAAPGPGLESEKMGDLPLDQPLLSPDTMVTAADVARQHDVSVTSGRTVASLTSEWADTSDEARRALVGDRLAALMRVEPGVVPEVERLVTADSAKTRWALRALSDAATPATERVLLRTISNDALPNEVRSSAGTALATTAHVDTAVCDELSQLVPSLPPPLRGIGLLAYGAWVRRLIEQKDPTATAHLEALMRRTTAAKSDAVEYARYLDALGNAGAPQVEPVLTDGVTNADEHVRAVSVGALRAISSASAAHVIEKTMLGDRSPKVRSAAILSASFRPIAPFLPTLTELLRREDKAEVRKRVVAWIASKRSEDPKLVQILQNQAKTDPDSGVREQCSELLHGALAGQKASGVP